jgi:hypothetical protein
MRRKRLHLNVFESAPGGIRTPNLLIHAVVRLSWRLNRGRRVYFAQMLWPQRASFLS